MHFEEQGTTAAAIIRILGKALDFTLARKELIDATGLGTNAVRSALYRLKKKGFVFNPEKGIWKLIKIYRKIRHCKRIVETRQATKKRSFDDCDCEATSEGFVPVTGIKGAFPPDRPDDATTRRYAGIINPKLEEEMLLVLANNGVILRSTQTGIQPTCSPRLVKSFNVPRFCIEGTEWLDEVSPEFNDKHIVDVVSENEQDVKYPTDRRMGVWEGAFYVSEDEF